MNNEKIDVIYKKIDKTEIDIQELEKGKDSIDENLLVK